MSTFANLNFVNTANRYQEDFDLSFLDDKTVVKAGILESQETGRLGNFAIDYEDNGVIKRVIFGIGDERSDMYILWKGTKGIDNAEDILKEKISRCYDDLCRQKITIVGDPTNLSYSFIGDGGKEIMSLSILEIKIAGDVSKYFSSAETIKEKWYEIIYSLSLWALN